MSKETIEEPMNTIINKDAEDEFYDANDIVELVENKFGKMNLDKERLSDENPSDKDEDFQSLPPINTRVSHLKELEEKVKELEKEDERINEEKEENDDKEYSDEEYEENNAGLPLHEKLNKEMKKRKRKIEDHDHSEADLIKDDPYLIDEDLLRLEQENLTDEEKQEKLKQAQEIKQSGNVQFRDEKYTDALELYTKALQTCPVIYEKERSVFYSNRSLCFFKMNQLDRCAIECTKSIELDTTFSKPVMRRAECYESLDKLDEALIDYKKMIELEKSNISNYRQKCHELEEKIKERNEKMKTEMMGKLKDLGNMFLKPFGMSTDMFQFVQDPATGSYSMNIKK